MPTKGADLSFPEVSLPNFVWQRCREFGDRVAMMDIGVNGELLTFGEVYTRSKNIAAFLVQKGVKTGDIIGLCAPNSSAYPIAMLGIMGCGATIAPLDPACKEGEILHSYRISKPTIVIVHEERVETMEIARVQLPCIKEIFVMGKSNKYITVDSMSKSTVETDCLKTVGIRPREDVAMLPCSSGTTGLPKCVMLTHYNLLAMMFSFLEHSKWSTGEAKVLYMDRPMYNISGILDVMLCFTLGMKGVVEKKSGLKRMLHAIETHKVTHFLSVPFVVIEFARSEETVEYDTSSLVGIMFGGAPIAADIQQTLEEKLKFPMAQHYGLTEAENLAFCHFTQDCPSTIGTVSPGVELKIVDPVTCREYSVNQVGEICARGPQLMKGYLSNPEATAKAIDKEGWMHTGDLGYLDEKGRLFFNGRIKELIKYKGFQVAPAELESVLLRHPKIADAGVVGIPDTDAGELPKAYVVKKCTSLTKKEIHTFMKSKLIDYKQLRGGISFVKKIPTSKTGKMQRDILKHMTV